MFHRRRDKQLPSDTYQSAIELYADVRSALREKADHNKRESHLFFLAAIGFSLAVPLFVTLGEGLILGKVIPATLSALAAGSISWLQLRRPQSLWAVYRRAQRELEREKTEFDFGLAHYEGLSDPEKHLARRVADISFGVHERWEELVPAVEDLAAAIDSAPADKNA